MGFGEKGTDGHFFWTDGHALVGLVQSNGPPSRLLRRALFLSIELNVETDAGDAADAAGCSGSLPFEGF